MKHRFRQTMAIIVGMACAEPGASTVIEVTANFNSAQSSAAFVDTTPALPCFGGACADPRVRLVDTGVIVNQHLGGDATDSQASLGMSIPATQKRVTVSDGRNSFDVYFRITAQGFALAGSGVTREIFIDDGMARPRGDCHASVTPTSGTLTGVWAATGERTMCHATVKAGVAVDVRQQVSLAYQLGLPSPLKIPSGVYTGEVRYAVGMGQDLDFAGGTTSESEVVFRLNLGVTHELRVDFGHGPGGAPIEVELVPAGGWSAWPRGRVPASVQADVPFQLSLSGPTRMYLRCQDTARCTMRSAAGDTVTLAISASIPGAVTAAGEQAMARTSLPIGEAQALTIIPSGTPLRSQVSVLHAATQGALRAGTLYEGEAVLVLDAN
ncbi:hypothetical protein [Pinirhizobacter soli]|uniref:hypothetical protein n=1 Tax=Pinirhizobacter soli TaxID=2786953 RepID=UPI00202A37AC|nr:hypothetical protein [Pinirhizobacter soli]